MCIITIRTEFAQALTSIISVHSANVCDANYYDRTTRSCDANTVEVLTE